MLSLGEELSCVQVYALKDEVEDKAVIYPDYYLQPFHAYPKGNLEWLPAFEVESATMSMAVRTFPGTEPVAAQRRLRDNIHAAIRVHRRHLISVSHHSETVQPCQAPAIGDLHLHGRQRCINLQAWRSPCNSSKAI